MATRAKKTDPEEPNRVISVRKVQSQETLDGTTEFSLSFSESEDVKLNLKGDAMEAHGMAELGDECRLIFADPAIKKKRTEPKLLVKVRKIQTTRTLDRIITFALAFSEEQEAKLNIKSEAMGELGLNLIGDERLIVFRKITTKLPSGDE